MMVSQLVNFDEFVVVVVFFVRFVLHTIKNKKENKIIIKKKRNENSIKRIERSFKSNVQNVQIASNSILTASEWRLDVNFRLISVMWLFVLLLLLTCLPQ